MAELENILGAMDRINREMRVVVHKAGEDLNSQIVSLRQEFAAETGHLISQLPGDVRLRSRPELFSEFQDRLSAVRTKLASHQAKWTIEDINEHRDTYLDATESVHGSIAAYVDWAKHQLSGR